jgi:hypothetical protein
MRYVIIIACYLLILIAVVFPATAQQVPSTVDAEHHTIIAFIQPIASKARVLVNDLVIWETESVFGVWVYQVNLTAWLDTEPTKVQIQVHLGNNQQAYCNAELRSGSGNLEKAHILEKVSFSAADTTGNQWNRFNTIIGQELSRPNGAVRPIWAVPHEHRLAQAIKSNSTHLVKVVQNSLQTCSFSELMPLITPALTNQAMMEGVSPGLLIHMMTEMLKRNCIPNIEVADTMRQYHKGRYKDIMAPINYEDLTYRFAKTDQDKRGNLYTPVQAIEFRTSDNRQFNVNVFLSYTDGRRNRRFISRFSFDRTR